MGARAWPFGGLCLGPERFGLRNSLRSDSPRPHIEFGTGAQPRPQAPWVAPFDGALQLHNTKTKERKKRHGMARGHMQKTLDPRLLMSRMTEGGEGGEGGPHLMRGLQLKGKRTGEAWKKAA